MWSNGWARFVTPPDSLETAANNPNYSAGVPQVRTSVRLDFLLHSHNHGCGFLLGKTAYTQSAPPHVNVSLRPKKRDGVKTRRLAGRLKTKSKCDTGRQLQAASVDR